MKQKRSHTLPALWTLRLLVNAGCYGALRRHRDWPDTSICELLDLPFAEANRDNQGRVLGRLERMLAELEQSPPAADKDTVAYNVALLGERPAH